MTYKEQISNLSRLDGPEAHPTWLVALIALVIAAPSLHAQEATQTINLVNGWNAIWLEVEPDDVHPTVAFDTATNSSIQVIASPKPLAGLAEFFGGTPGTENGSFNQAEWEQWLRSDVGNSNLVMTTGNRGYLIRTTGAVTVNVNGKVRFYRPNWTPDRYNLVGFGIDGVLSFEDFFKPSNDRHPFDNTTAAGVPKIYRLTSGGAWTPAVKTAPIQDGVAYWVFSSGPSQYMGPVAVDFEAAVTGSLSFGGPSDVVEVGALEMDLEELVFTNLGTTDARPKLDLRTGTGDLTLRVVKAATVGDAYEAGNAVDTNPGTDASPSAIFDEDIGTLTTVTRSLGAQRNWVSGDVSRTNVYRLHTGGGTKFWLPISALNTDVPLPEDILVTGAGSVAGLWVGEISVDAVTSIVEDGEQSRSSAGSAPLRILLHSDDTGKVRLLSQVTIMQTKTADPEVDPVPILVIDPKRIPFFDGIKERNGKRVGLRLESVAFDMPRSVDATSQAALLADEAYPDLTDEAGIPDFLNSRSSRPPSLKEEYELSLLLEGAIGSGKTVRTTSAKPLNLDPFHRSNPLRHGLHREHVRGPNITRTISIVFDSDSSVTDHLRGTFTETLQGLIKTNLQLTGRVEMRRVSSVNSLDGAE